MPNFLERLPKLPLAAEMAVWDANTIDFGISEVMLMEQAGRAIFTVAQEKYGPLAHQSVWLFMGGGNNGGDAAVMARLIQDAGGHALVFCQKPIDALGPSPAFHTRLARANGAFFQYFHDAAELGRMLAAESSLPLFLVDALLGTGFKGMLKDSTSAIIGLLNDLPRSLGRPMLAVDIPSGLNADTGQPSPDAIKAACTVTLAAAKPGLLLPHARQYTGQVICRPIGIPRAVWGDCPAQFRLLDGHALIGRSKNPAGAYKNIFGHVLVIGGYCGYTGAAHLASAAALRTGCGLISACAPRNSLAEIKGNWPEIMTIAADPGSEWPQSLPQTIIEAIDRVDALVIGPGLGRSDAALQLLGAILSVSPRPPAVVDADALALLGLQQISLGSILSERDIITPHPGEAALLLGCNAKDVQANRPSALDELCLRTDAAVILKGAGTLVGQGAGLRLLSPYDIPQLAIGGAGDVLAGCAGALLAMRKGSHPLAVAGEAVTTHALAALCLVNRFPERGFRASELADALPHVRQFLADYPEPLQGSLPWPALT